MSILGSQSYWIVTYLSHTAPVADFENVDAVLWFAKSWQHTNKQLGLLVVLLHIELCR